MPTQNGPSSSGPSPESGDHRYARAAGRAARAFLDSSRQDAEVRAERRRRAEEEVRREDELRDRRRQEAAEQQAEQDRQARTAAQTGPASGPLKLARWWWAGVSALFAALSTVFVLSGLRVQSGGEPVGGAMPGSELPPGIADPLEGSTGQFALATITGILALACLVGLVQLLRRRRSAVGLLTSVALIVGVPLMLRPSAVLVFLAAVLLLGAVLLWLPPVRRQLR